MTYLISFLLESFVFYFATKRIKVKIYRTKIEMKIYNRKKKLF